MAQSRTKDMTQGPILPLIVKFSLPLLMGNLFQQTYNLVDTAIVGQTLGAKALAAVGSSTSIQFLVMGFCIGMSLGFSIPVGQRFGAKDYSGMHRYEYAGGILAALFAALVTLLTTVFCNHILHLLQVPEEIFHDAWVYLIIIFCEIPFTVMYNYLAGLMRAIGDSKTPFIYLAVASVLNIGLDFLFIVNVGMGVAGAALATVLSQALLALLSFMRWRAVTMSFISKKRPVTTISLKEETSWASVFPWGCSTPLRPLAPWLCRAPIIPWERSLYQPLRQERRSSSFFSHLLMLLPRLFPLLWPKTSVPARRTASARAFTRAPSSASFTVRFLAFLP